MRILIFLGLLSAVSSGGSADLADRLTRACLVLKDGVLCEKLVEFAARSHGTQLEVISIAAPPLVPLVHYVVDKSADYDVIRVSDFCERSGLGSFDCAALQRAVRSQSAHKKADYAHCDAGAVALQRLAYSSTFPKGYDFSEAFGFEWIFSGAAEERAWTHLLDKILDDDNSDKIFLDVGANRGDFTRSLLALHKKNTTWHIYQFEPDDEIVDVLKANEQKDNVHIQLIQAAVTDFNGESTLFLSSNSPHPHGSLLDAPHRWKYGNGSSAQVKVPTITIDTWFNQTITNKRIDIIKLDVEGVEPSIFRGGKYLLSHYTDVLIFEYSHGWSTTGASLRSVLHQQPLQHFFGHVYLVGADKALLDLSCWHHDFESFWWSNVIAVNQKQRPKLAQYLQETHQAWLQFTLGKLISSISSNCQLLIRPDLGLILEPPPLSHDQQHQQLEEDKETIFLLERWRNHTLEFAQRHALFSGEGCVDSLPCVANLLLANLITACLPR